MPRLTKQLIDETPFPATGQVFVRDTELRGFALRVTQGRKAFILEKRIRGRMRRLTLGLYGPITLEQARSLPSFTSEPLHRAPIQRRSDRIGCTHPHLAISPRSIWSAMRRANVPPAMTGRCSPRISRSFAPGG